MAELPPPKRGGIAAGVSGRHAEDFFCLWKYCNLSNQGTRGVTFYLCISAKVNEKIPVCGRSQY